MANPTPIGQNSLPLLGNYQGTSIYGAMSPNLTGNWQLDQNAANQANTQRYNQGLQNLMGGYNAGNASMQQAMTQSQNYGQSAQQKLNLQLQQQLGQQSQSAVSRGLSGTTIADTMKDLPQRQYNDATLQNNEQVANRQTGLLMNQANMQTQGANSISNFIASKNDVGPNQEMLAQLQKQASSNPGQRNVAMSGGGPAGGGQSDFMAGQNRPFSNPNTSNGGGSSSASGGTSGQLYYPGQTGFGAPGTGGQSSISGAMGGGYTGGNVQQNAQAGSQGQDDAGGMGGSAFFANGSSVTPGTPPGPWQTSGSGTTFRELSQQQPAASAPTPISSAAQPQQPAAKPPCPWFDQMTGSCPG